MDDKINMCLSEGAISTCNNQLEDRRNCRFYKNKSKLNRDCDFLNKTIKGKSGNFHCASIKAQSNLKEKKLKRKKLIMVGQSEVKNTDSTNTIKIAKCAEIIAQILNDNREVINMFFKDLEINLRNKEHMRKFEKDNSPGREL